MNKTIAHISAVLLLVAVARGQEPASAPVKPLSVREQLERLAAEEAANAARKPSAPAVRRAAAPASTRKTERPAAVPATPPAPVQSAEPVHTEGPRPLSVVSLDKDAVSPAVMIGAGAALFLLAALIFRRRLRKRFDDLTVRMKIAIVSAASVLPLMLFILGYLLPKYAQDKFNERSMATRQVVDIAYNLMQEYDDRITKGEFTEAEGKKRYIDRINRMRYNTNDYMWVNDLHPRMVFHPIKKEMNGTDLSEYKDPNGLKLFVEMVNICRTQGEGSVLYEWPKPGHEEPALKISYVRLFRPWGWIVGSGVYADDIETQVAGMRRDIMAGAFLVSLLAIGFGVAVGGWYRNDLSAVVQKMDHAELRMRFHAERKDEIGDLQRSFDAFVSNIHDTLSDVMNASERVAGATVQISSSAEQLAAGSEEQSSQASEVTAAVTDMTATISENAKNAVAAAAIARRAKEAAAEGGRVVEGTVSGMRTIADVVEQSAVTVQTLGRSSDEIGEIVLVINEIADQTNLLALNAAIEAARAGDQGRGFAVVADEVRRLAERTTKATKEIATMIGRIQTETKRAVGVMHEGTRKVHDGIVQADKAGEALKGIVEISQQVTDMVSQIAEADERQSSTSGMITRNVDGISAVAHESANSTQQIAQAAEELNRMTEQLQAMLSRFNLGTGERTVAETPVRTAVRAPGVSQKAVAENGMIVDHR